MRNNGNGGEKPGPSGSFSLRFLRSARANSASSDGSTHELVLLGERSPVAEAYRVLRTSVLFSTADIPPKTILFTSGQPGEGKTTTVINTAISLAQLGASVLVIDADLRKPSTHKGLNVSSDQGGLSAYLSSGNGTDVDQFIQKVKVRNLSLMACGPIPGNPSELLSSDKMKNLLATLRGRYDHILIDSPPILHVTDPVILSTLVDGVILVVHGGRSSREVVKQSRHLLTNVGANIFGVVLNNVRLQDQPYIGFPYYPYEAENRREPDEVRVSDIFS
jgi:capsular exopolysaccharide synthesis family protein